VLRCSQDGAAEDAPPRRAHRHAVVAYRCAGAAPRTVPQAAVLDPLVTDRALRRTGSESERILIGNRWSRNWLTLAGEPGIRNSHIANGASAARSDSRGRRAAAGPFGVEPVTTPTLRARHVVEQMNHEKVSECSAIFFLISSRAIRCGFARPKVRSASVSVMRKAGKKTKHRRAEVP